jgi:tetratricopeptide (TPR) repeat protein
MYVVLIFAMIAGNSYAQISFNQAQEKYEGKKYSDAVSILDKLILKNDKDTQSYFLRARCSFELKRVQNAYNDFTKYIEFDPSNALAYLYRGKILEGTDQYFDAINDYNAAIKYGKDTVLTSGYFHRGSCYLSVNNKKQAYNDLLVSYQRNPTDKYIRLNYGTVLCQLDSVEHGIGIFKQLLMEDKNDYIACQNIGYFSMNKEEYDTALVYFNRTLEINPKMGLTYNNRGFLKYKMGNNQEALKDVNTSLKLDKTNSFAYKNRALISIAEGKTEEACDDLIKARSLGFADKYGNEVNQLIQQNCKNR